VRATSRRARSSWADSAAGGPGRRGCTLSMATATVAAGPPRPGTGSRTACRRDFRCMRRAVASSHPPRRRSRRLVSSSTALAAPLLVGQFGQGVGGDVRVAVHHLTDRPRASLEGGLQLGGGGREGVGWGAVVPARTGVQGGGGVAGRGPIERPVPPSFPSHLPLFSAPAGGLAERDPAVFFDIFLCVGYFVHSSAKAASRERAPARKARTSRAKAEAEDWHSLRHRRHALRGTNPPLNPVSRDVPYPRARTGRKRCRGRKGQGEKVPTTTSSPQRTHVLPGRTRSIALGGARSTQLQTVSNPKTESASIIPLRKYPVHREADGLRRRGASLGCRAAAGSCSGGRPPKTASTGGRARAALVGPERNNCPPAGQDLL
jgi:hypothetical protein